MATFTTTFNPVGFGEYQVSCRGKKPDGSWTNQSFACTYSRPAPGGKLIKPPVMSVKDNSNGCLTIHVDAPEFLSVSMSEKIKGLRWWSASDSSKAGTLNNINSGGDFQICDLDNGLHQICAVWIGEISGESDQSCVSDNINLFKHCDAIRGKLYKMDMDTEYLIHGGKFNAEAYIRCNKDGTTYANVTKGMNIIGGCTHGKVFGGDFCEITNQNSSEYTCRTKSPNVTTEVGQGIVILGRTHIIYRAGMLCTDDSEFTCTPIMQPAAAQQAVVPALTDEEFFAKYNHNNRDIQLRLVQDCGGGNAVLTDEDKIDSDVSPASVQFVGECQSCKKW